MMAPTINPKLNRAAFAAVQANDFDTDYSGQRVQIITQQYYQRSELKKNMLENLQTFMTRAHSNQLATRSKMERWLHDSPTCPKCFDAYEDLLYTLLTCPENLEHLNPMAQKIQKTITQGRNLSTSSML
jgi:hypothetical protein